MKIGETIGNYDGFIKLKIGNETGLDIISKSRKIIIEQIQIIIRLEKKILIILVFMV